MRLTTIVLLSALFLALGCEKSQEKPAVQTDRTKDSAYTARLEKIRGEQAKIAAAAQHLREQAKTLEADPAKQAEYVDVTNRLAKCASDMEASRKQAGATVRARILKEKAARDAVKTGRATEAK